MVYKYFNKKTSSGTVKNEIISNKKLAAELHKLIIRKFNKRKVQPPFIDNIWGADLADMQLRSKFNKEFRFFLFVIDIYRKYAWVIPLNDKKGIVITYGFQKVLDGSNRKPNEIWVDKGSAFYNRQIKSFLQNNHIEMYSTNNEGKSVIAERFIRFTSISKSMYIDKLGDIVNKFNNTYHSTIKMKPVDVKSSTYINSSKEINNKDPKFRIGDIVRISKYKNIFAKGYTPSWSKEVFVIKKVKNNVP